jgi:multidrug resistance efflux pump
LDDSLLQAQKGAADAALVSAQAALRSAEVALQTAQAQYDLTLAAALEQEAPLRLETWFQVVPTEFDQPGWYFDKPELTSALENQVAAAEQELADTRTALANIENQVGSAEFLKAEADLAVARVAYQIASTVLDRANDATDGTELRDEAQAALDEAKVDLEDAQSAYDDALTTEGAQDILEARARVMVAQEQLDSAKDALRALQTGAQSPEVVLAGQVVNQAQAQVDQAQAGVEEIQANLDLLEVQIEKLTVLAPIDGVVLTLSISSGEVLQAGMTAMQIADLDSLTVTVYIPEDRYGEVSLGNQATLLADSFPGETFTAIVTRIADQAEYTPRNVQTSEERQTTVYAVELAVDNPNGKLKPGMPVDVDFDSTGK